MELEIKTYSKLYLRRNLRSIFPQEENFFKCIPRRKNFNGFENCYKYCMNQFYMGEGDPISTPMFVGRYLCKFLLKDKIDLNKLKIIFRCIIFLCPNELENIIPMLIKKSYEYNNPSLFIIFADQINIILPRQKITSQNFLNRLRDIDLNRKQNHYPYKIYEMTLFFVNHFGN